MARTCCTHIMMLSLDLLAFLSLEKGPLNALIMKVYAVLSGSYRVESHRGAEGDSFCLTKVRRDLQRSGCPHEFKSFGWVGWQENLWSTYRRFCWEQYYPHVTW